MPELIERTGTISFQNKSGITLESFLELLEVYCQSAIVQHDGNFVIQSRGICNGSCVTPVLYNIFLAKFHSVLQDSFQDRRIVNVFRYVDDF